MVLRAELKAWVEQRIAPEGVKAAPHEGDDRAAAAFFARPLCPYPQQAFCDVSDPQDQADSFESRIADEPEFEDLGQAWLR